MNIFRLASSLLRSILSSIASDPEVKKIIERNPRFFHFLKKRIAPDEMFGLHLTIGALCTALFVLFFFSVVRHVLGNDTLIESDVSIVNFLQLIRLDGVDQGALFFGTLGRWSVIFIGVCATAIVCIRGRRWHTLIALVTAVSVAIFFSGMLREVIETIRPSFANTLVTSRDATFPSGHASVAFTFYGLVTYLLVRSRTSWIARIVSALGGITLISVIALSGMYLGLYWPSDTVASMASAAVWIAIVITVLEIRRAVRLPYEEEDDRSISTMHTTGIIAFVCWVLLGGYLSSAFPLHGAQPIRPPLQSMNKQDIPGKLFDTLPRYSDTLLGNHTEPINIIVVGKKDVIDDAFTKSGWIYPGTITLSNLWGAAVASIKNTQDLRAPITPMFWNTLPNTSAYFKPTPQNSVRERHHIRLWNSGIQTTDGDTILFGAASFDKGIKLKSAIIIPTHIIDPAIDKEREYVKQSLESTGLVERVIPFAIVEPTLGKNIVGDTFFTDGKSVVIFLDEAVSSYQTSPVRVQ